MLRHSTTITPAVPYGGDLSALGRLRQLDKLGGPDTLSQYAREALLGGPDGMIAVSWETLIELESNRTGYDVALAATFLDTGAAPALVDSSVGAIDVVADARRNPTIRAAIADVTFADDGVAVAGGTSSGTDVQPYGVVGSCQTTVRGADATGGIGWNRTGTGVFVTASDAASPYPGTVKRAFTVATPGIGDVYFAPTSQAAYRIPDPAAGGRPFAETAYFTATGGQLVARFRVRFTDAAIANGITFAGPAFTIPATGTYTRQVSQILTDAASKVSGTWLSTRLYRTVRFELEVLAGTTATAFRWAAPELYAGSDRGPLGGILAAAPANGGVALTYGFRYPDASTRQRLVSRVDVHGDAANGMVTAARVIGTNPGGVAGSVELGVAASAGRLSIPFAPTTLEGVVVVVEEVSSGDGGAVWLNEVDPSYVLDVSDRVIAASTAASRELDPGSATLPLGNVQASTLSLDLDNSARDLSPSSNAMIGTAHRIETAVRIRYANRVPIDPRTWPVRSTGTGGSHREGGGDGTVNAWVTATAGSSGSPYVEARKLIPVPADAATIVYGAWLRYGPATLNRPTVSIVNYAGTTSLSISNAPAGAVDRWQYVGGSVAVNGDTLISMRSTAGANPGVSVDLAGDPSVVFLDAAGNVIETVEALPAGVYFSTGWDSASDSSTVQVAAVDRLGRFGDRDVDEPVTTAVDPLAAIRAYALRYLDLGEDELSLSLSSGYVFPYLFPTGSIGTTLADIAKATNAVLGLDKLDRLTLIERATVPATSAVTVDGSNAVIRARTPIVEEQIANVIDAEAAPLDGVPATVLYELGETEAIALSAAGTLELWLPYTASPATGVTLSTFTKTGTVTAALTAFSDTAKLTLSGGASGGTVTAIALTGTKLETRSIKVRAEHAASIRRYDRRPRTITAALVQTVAQLQAIANAIRDAFSGIDATSGERQLPDVEVDTLGLPYLELGDRLTIAEASSGIAGEYQLVSSRLDFGEATSLRTSGRARRVDDALLARADTSLADNAELASY